MPHRNVSSYYGEVFHDSVEEASSVAHWCFIVSDAPEASSQTNDRRRVIELRMLSIIVHVRRVGNVIDICLRVA